MLLRTHQDLGGSALRQTMSEGHPETKLRGARIVGHRWDEEIDRVPRAQGVAQVRVVRQVVDLQEKACLVARKPTGVLKSAVENRLVLTVDPIPNGHTSRINC